MALGCVCCDSSVVVCEMAINRCADTCRPYSVDPTEYAVKVVCMGIFRSADRGSLGLALADAGNPVSCCVCGVHPTNGEPDRLRSIRYTRKVFIQAGRILRIV